MCSLKKIRMFRHPCILKYIEGNESDTGVFYVRLFVVCLYFAVGDGISDSTI